MDPPRPLLPGRPPSYRLIVKDSSQLLSATPYDSLAMNLAATMPPSHTSHDDHNHFEEAVIMNSIPPSLLRLHDDEDL